MIEGSKCEDRIENEIINYYKQPYSKGNLVNQAPQVSILGNRAPQVSFDKIWSIGV